ncbi:MAG: HD domain-containing protein [Desulfobulbaceae bacterium]|nr:HD domain-containing protein [Desulfobulbaceae bacterium]HIJ91185.1 HD domain-containing protein [Deltaproteobacteria bacterium]
MTENPSCLFGNRGKYAGRILSGRYSDTLKKRLASSIAHFKALEGMGAPVIPYIAAWLPEGGHIWYEYAGARLHTLLGFHTTEVAGAFRDNILTRCLYRIQKNPPSIDKIIRDKAQIGRLREAMRRMAERGGGVDAVYKFDVNGSPLWLKDLARVEIHDRDRVVLSYGTLIDVTKEMQLEETLVEMQCELESHRENLVTLVEDRTRELKKAQLDVLTRLTQAAAFRDGETGAHIIRMSQYCTVLGSSCGLSKSANTVLFHAVPMHDVGKLGIADSILQKQGSLSLDEFEVIKTHCQVGSDLLSDGKSTLLQVAQTIALTHHERWDGSGYPQGLVDRQIPLASRITAICDVFDALTSERPYKKAWRFEDAVDEIWRLRKIYFDPKLVDLFVKNIPQIKKVYQQAPMA